MEVVKRDFGNLPYEVLFNIFDLTGEYSMDKKLCFNYALVCKAWLSPAQSALYSNVAISSISQLRNFYNTVEKNPQLGRKVKIFHLGIHLPHHYDEVSRGEPFDQTFDLLSNLLSFWLPNLEQFTETSLTTYVPILNALLDSRLKHLKILPKHCFTIKREELNNYAICTLLMCNRIEKIILKENFMARSEPLFNSLYDKLNQFSNLTQLSIEENTAEAIQVLEHVLSACKSLKEIHFLFEESGNATTSNDAISNFTPAYNIGSLDASVDLNDSKILWYIMRKFPNLHTLKLDVDFDSRAKLHHGVLPQLLKYLNKINHLEARNLRVDNYNNLVEAFGDCWEETSNPGKESLVVSYGQEEYEPFYFDLFNTNGLKESTLYSFFYSDSTFEQQYIDFIRKNGRYIGEICFDFLNDFEVNSTGFPENCIAQTFKQCANLRILTFEKGELNLQYSNMNLCERLSLDELYLNRCNFSPGSQECLSLLVPDVKRLRINAAGHHDSLLQVIMPNTKIDSVIFEFEERSFFQVFNVTDAAYYYYHLSKNVFEDSNEQEYKEADDRSRAYICCQTKPTLQLKYSFF